ncbi:hypothetical protein BGZ65_003427 [Modicella reniformis]|uniref:Uncharacterized protein n=1 Tax=Modicella reniformis TaxID=1440133 RepID=A0A9P6MI04_9FUNG|nr:hypothetical protein BGZ65_003427 [Modicella reniformis]
MCPNIFDYSTSCACGAQPVKDDTTIVLTIPSDEHQREYQADDAEQECDNDVHKERSKTYSENDRLLSKLSSHLDLLTAGSLFLLPSILPYLASALVSYNSSFSLSSSPSTSSSLSSSSLEQSQLETTSVGMNLGIAWAVFLPCIGVIVPLALFKIMTSLEQRATPTPHRAWVMACPTVSAIKRTWKALRGHPPGYGPLALDTSSSSSSYDDSDDDENVSFTNSKSVRLSVLPRPKTIIMTSLGIWTILMVLSASMGFNTISKPASNSSVISDIMMPMPEDKLHATLSLWGSSLSKEARLGGFVVPEDIEDGQVSALTSVLDIDMSFDKSAFDGADEDQVLEQDREEEPFAIIRSNLVILKKQEQTPGRKQVGDQEEEEENNVEDFMDPEALEAMTLDPEDASVFQNFLVHLQADDEAAKARELAQHEQPSMLENKPCGYKNPSQEPAPAWMVQKFLNKANNIARSYLSPREQGRVFDYVSGWTELMVVAIAMCLGSLLVGLTQARVLHNQMLQQYEIQLFVFDLEASSQQRQRRVTLATFAACLLISGSALGLAMMMIFAECWDLPSVQFVGIGIAGMVLAHAWIPNLPLHVECVEDVNIYEYDSEDDDEEVSGDEEKGSYVQRHSACSLDETR